MLNDLPSDIEVLDQLDISQLDPMLKDYVFGSFFLARLVDKTLADNKRLQAENAELKAKIEECAVIQKRFEEIKHCLEGLPTGFVPPVMDEDAEETSAENKKGFVARNKEGLKDMLAADSAAVSMDIPTEEIPLEDTANEITFDEELPLDGISLEDELPLEDIPMDEIPLEDVPVEEIPLEEAPIEEIPLEEAPVEEIPLEEAPAPEPAPAPAVEIPSDPNAALTPEQIAALFSQA